MKLLPLLLTIALTLFASTVHAEEEGFWKRLGLSLGKESVLDSETIEAGLREALKVGIDNAIKDVGKHDGYLKNDLIHIDPPRSIKRMEKVMRRFGYGDAYDEFELSMNRAAEAAAPLAKDIFLEALVQMDVRDARRILKGTDTEATDYFRERTSAKLTESFAPIIKDTMAQFGVVRKYQEVVGQYDSIPIVRNYTGGNIEEHTTAKALDGLFYVLAQEEIKIRKNPAAQTSSLLKKVFGKH